MLCAVLCAAPLLILAAIAGVIAPIVPAIAGIVVGAGALALLVVWMVRRRRQVPQNDPTRPTLRKYSAAATGSRRR